MKNINYRKCIGCGAIKPRLEMLKITRNSLNKEILVNPDSKIFGRSAYLCYNQDCIKTALKNNKLNKALRTSIDLKGLLDGQYQGK